jgi:hypothetical protein
MGNKKKTILAAAIAGAVIYIAVAYATAACPTPGCPTKYKKVLSVCVPC